MDHAREHLEQIEQKIQEKLRQTEASILAGEQEVEDMHEYYWLNYTEMDQYGYEDFDNQQALLNQINANQALLEQKKRLKKMLDSPYFGRIDFVYQGEEEPETFYIGIHNFAPKQGGIPLIYDWRAPVSALFYDYDRGPAGYDAPAGRMEGEILSKWQYKISRGKLVYAFESDVKIDDEVLRRELGNGSDAQLKTIINTIQKEQNAIIRNTKDRILIVQGVAGSGKTSVALHRVAYLLYHDREHLKARNVLILSPNSVFSDYISHVLPELGEENIREMSFDLFAYRELNAFVADCEDRYYEIERSLWSERTLGTASGGRFADDRQLACDLREYALLAEDDLMDFRSFSFKKFRVQEEKMTDLFYNRFPDIPLLGRMKAVGEYLVDEYETLHGTSFSEEDLEQIMERFDRMYRTTDLYRIYRDFLDQYGYPVVPDVPKEKRILSYEHVYPMLYLKILLFGSRKHSQIRHLVIDEMQDYSYLQYLILGNLFQCPMTIVGDRMQTMEARMVDVTSFLPEIFGRHLRTIELNRSYRNTVEIASYAKQIGQDMEMKLFERHGFPVQTEEFADLEEAVKAAWEICRDMEPGASAGILLISEDEAKEAFSIIKGLREESGEEERAVHYIDRDTSTFGREINVTSFYLAKGLEFDQVVMIHQKRNGDMPLHRQAEFICATRAMHRLYDFSW